MSEMSPEVRQPEPAQEGKEQERRSPERASSPRAIAATPRTSKSEPSAGLQRTAAAIRTMVPLAQKLLPLLDGNVASAVANLLAPRAPAGPPVDLQPLETAIRQVRGDLAVMQDKSAQQDTALKRIDDQLETVKESLERASVEQKEAAEELTRTRKSVRTFAILGVILLFLLIGLNVALFVYVKGGLR